MPDYQKSKIYKLCCGDLIYYGSTCNQLRVRKSQHKCNYKRYKEGRGGSILTSSQLFELDEDNDFKNVKIYNVEDYPCNSKEELLKRERWWIENNDCVNKFIPCRTKKEYQENNKDKIREYQKEYRDVNKEKIKKQKKEYREENKDKMKEYREENKEKIKKQRKEYREENKDKIKEYQKKYKKKNKDKIKEYKEKNKDKINARRRENYRYKKELEKLKNENL